MNVLLVGIGGFFGAVGRYLISVFISGYFNQPFPIATLLVNVIGSFGLGILVGHLTDSVSPHPLMLMVGFGVIGAFTTFSAFSLETLQLLRNGNHYWGYLNIGMNLILSLAALWVGEQLAIVRG